MPCNNHKTALVIFAFNRPKHFNILLQSIERNQIISDYCFHIFHDGPKNVMTAEIQDVRELTSKFVKKVVDFEVSLYEHNLGLAKSVREGLNTVFSVHSEAIILEDDIIPNKSFYKMIQFFLHAEADNGQIGSITGANTTKFPIMEKRDFLLSKRHCSWGWATWADRWNSIDWKYAESDIFQDKKLLRKVNCVSPDLVRYAKLQKTNKIDSWATAMNIDFIKRGLLCVVPKESFVQNIGFDGSGTHTGVLNQDRNQFTFVSIEKNINFEIASPARNIYYDLLVQKNNSLLRDFPKGSLIRIGLSLRRSAIELMNRISQFVD